jgi:hypothetical protein
LLSRTGTVCGGGGHPILSAGQCVTLSVAGCDQAGISGLKPQGGLKIHQCAAVIALLAQHKRAIDAGSCVSGIERDSRVEIGEGMVDIAFEFPIEKAAVVVTVGEPRIYSDRLLEIGKRQILLIAADEGEAAAVVGMEER